MATIVATWQPIATAPRDGTWILLRGDSGYVRRPYRVHVGHWDAEYRPLSPWRTSEGSSFTDDGYGPTHWMALPEAMTPAAIAALAAEIVLRLREDAFDGDKWRGMQVAVEVVAAVLAETTSDSTGQYDKLLSACKSAVGFCVAFRLDVPDWQRFPEVGRLFALMTTAIRATENDGDTVLAEALEK